MTTLDFIITCPYDPTHRIRNSVRQYHFVRCRKNHRFTAKVQCPFDACHIIDEAYYEDHVANCASNANDRNYESKSGAQDELGTVSLEAVKNLSVPVMQDWSKEYVPSYDPWKNTETRDIVRCLMGGTKSQRKQFKLAERRRIESLENKDAIDLKCVKPSFQRHKTLDKYINVTQLIANMRTLSLQDIDALLKSLDFSKLFISDVTSASFGKKHLSELIERVLAQKLKEMIIHYIK